MNTISEGTASSLRILRTVQPTRSLVDQSKPLAYVRSEQTDIRRTLEKFARLARLQGAK
jgi:hypothetical protein